MKIPLALTVLILAAGTMIGWKNHLRLTVLNSEEIALTTSGSGPAARNTASDKSSANSFQFKRPRPENPNDTQTAPKRLMAAIKNFEADLESPNADPGTAAVRSSTPFEILKSMDGEELKSFLTTLHADKTLRASTIGNFSNFGLRMLAEIDGKTALELYLDRPDFSDREETMNRSEIFLRIAIVQWAQQDPAAALEWIRKNQGESSKAEAEQMKSGLLSAVVTKDFEGAVRMLDQIDFGNLDSAGGILGIQAKTPDAIYANLKTLRHYLSGMQDLKKKNQLQKGFLAATSRTLQGQDFQQSTSCLEKAELSPAEATVIGASISGYSAKKELGKWIGWMAANVPAEPLNEQISSIMINWASTDVEEAGAWLLQAPDNAAKIPAVQSYVRTVARHEPENAEQWALTLPAGGERNQLIREIHQNWPEKDAGGKAAFAGRHGIK